MRRATNVHTFTKSGETGNILHGTFSVNAANMVGVLSTAYRATDHALMRWASMKVKPNREQPVPSPELDDS
jgi:hypothetical protein